jgi:hypothetical protein
LIVSDEVAIMPATVPKVRSVEVVAARPTEADRAMIGQLAAEARRPIPETAFIVKVRLETIPPPTGQGWALYVGDTRIPKYWEYPGGIYFKVLDEEFLVEHQRDKLRFSENDQDFVDTGVRLPGPRARGGRRGVNVRGLPSQSTVLSETVPVRAVRERAVGKRARPARTKAGIGARRRKGRKSR